MKQPVMRIMCRQRPVLPMESFIKYIWKVIGNKDFLEFEATRIDSVVWPYQVLILWPENLLSDQGYWLVICKDDNVLVRYKFWQEENQVLLQRC